MNTALTAARALVSWFDFCEAIGVEWAFASEDELILFRDAHLNGISSTTGQNYSPSTARTRMIYIVQFCRFAYAQNWMSHAISVPNFGVGAYKVPIDSDMLAHTRKGASGWGVRTADGFLPKVPKDDKIRVMRKGELAAFLACAGPRPSMREVGDVTGCDRDRILVDLGWAAGLRADEKHKLTVVSFSTMVVENDSDIFKLRVIGKGSKARQVEIEGWLVRDVQAYIDGARSYVLRSRGHRSNETALFLNVERAGAKTRVGRPSTKGALQHRVTKLCIDAGLVDNVEKLDPVTGHRYVATVPRFSDHCLRHTYAVMTFHNMRAANYSDTEAWKYIQYQLGHEHLATTIETYLRHVSAWSRTRSSNALLGMVQR
nr:tyrosine-type recombinase/integrase [Halomonas sp.]|tara:strand:+ start:682 stop:1800 length:1119 start_codon:yes stop_codon:yes gene_type:complete